MKSLKIFLILSFFSTSLYSQKFEVTDSLVRNSAVFYNNWLSVYNEIIEIDSFKNELKIDVNFKREYDSTLYYRKEILRLNKSLLIVPSSIALVNLLFPPIIFPVLILSPMVVAMINSNYYLYLKSHFVSSTSRMVQLSGIDFEINKWVILKQHKIDFINLQGNEKYYKTWHESK
jgi:hypothetical protein